MSTRPTSDDLLSLGALGPVAVPSAPDVVADRLRRAIHLGVFCAGERVPPGRELAQRLGVSRVTVRAALGILRDAGYVVTRRGATGGTQVVSDAGTPDTHRPGLLARVDEVARVAQFRAIVEGGAAGLAATQRTDADLAALRTAVEELDEAPAALATFRRADARLHLAVARAAGNALLERSIVDAREAMFAPIDALAYRPTVARTRTEHRAIVAAIAAGDSPRAGALMRAHVHAGHAELRRVLGLVADGALTWAAPSA